MNVTDSQRATSAATLVLGGLGANLGLTLLSYLVNFVMPGSYDGPWPMIEELLWLGAVAVLVVGMFQLAGSVDDGAVLRIAAGVLIFNALIDTGLTLFMRRGESGISVGMLGPYISDASILLSIAARGMLIFALVQLTMKTHAWVLPLLGTVAVLTVMRSALSVAMMHQVVDYELYRNPAYRFGMPLVSLFNAGGLLVAAFALKAAVAGAVPGASNTPALVAAAGLRPAEPEPVSPASDFLVGGILLVVGIGVTAVSLSAASNGGRYVVATGAIGVGLGRIIRGLIRMGRT